MKDAAAYKEHLNPKNTLSFEEALGFDYGEWQAFTEDYGPFEPYLISPASPLNDDLADVISYTERLLGRLHERYEFRNEAAVETYIERHPSLCSLLTHAHDKIRKYFGPDTCAVLDVIKDNEVDDVERLFIFIQTDLSADEALDRLDELYEQWWLDALSTVRPKLSIDVEFV